MTGYTRQSVFVPGDIIKAEHGNDEFNQLVAAMAQATGHKHDGSAAEGAYVPLISDSANTDKVEIIAGGARTTGDHDVTGNITVGGTVDGRDVFADGTKLDGIEANATADQNAVDVPYTNTTSGLTATDVQAAIDEVEGRIDTLEGTDHTHSNKAVLDATTASFTTADETKLDGIEANATADQTAGEIKTAYESNANTNAFTDAEQSKLSGIEANATADQSAAEILAALVTVDGAGSGLDADLLDGQSSTYYTNASNLSSGTVSTARLPAASTTASGIVERATQAEVDAGTDTTRYVTPETLANAATVGVPVVSVGSEVSWEYPALATTTGFSYKTDPNDVAGQQFNIRVVASGTVRCSLEHSRSVAGSATTFARILKNGVQQVEWSTGSTSYTARTHDLAVSAGDVITFQQKETGSQTARWQNLELLGNVVFACNSSLGR